VLSMRSLADYNFAPFSRVARGFCAVWSRGRFPSEVPADGPLLTLLPGGSGGLVVVSNNDALVEPPAPVDVIFPVWQVLWASFRR
jgi:hypothetical protein